MADGGASWRLDPVCGWLEGVPVAGLRVSAYVLIRRDGGLTQYVPLHQRAWHATASRFEDRTGCNEFSIGIELEGWDRAVRRRSIPSTRRAHRDALGTLAGHPARAGDSDIAISSPGRKTGLGPAFEWRRLRTLLSIYRS